MKEGDLIITGPFEVIRTLLDGERVEVQERPAAAQNAGG